MRSYETLTKDEEIHLARAVEAGVYAEHLLRTEPPHPRHDPADLQDLAAAGHHAQELLWMCNLRMVAKIARAASHKHGMSYDDLFQEGCLSLAEAIIRFDFARGNKFSTLAHTYIGRRIGQSAAVRAGAVDALMIRARHQARLREGYATQSLNHDPSWKQVAASAGLSLAVAARASIRHVAFDETHPDLAQPDEGFEAVETCGVDFLNLMSIEGDLLRRRFGIGRPVQTLVEVGMHYGLSASTVSRMEERALERAREILSNEFCRQ